MPARHTSIVDLHLILRRDHQILLGERMNTGFADGSYALPAGHLEAGEAATQGMAREAREETAILIEPSDLTLVHVMHHHTNSGRVALFFEATDWIGEVVNCEPAKCAGWTWHSLDTLPERIVPYIAEALRCIRTHTLYSEGGWNELQRSNHRFRTT
jgi:ADP-ribose pyrophosphatase YjhB (NUDIX family)